MTITVNELFELASFGKPQGPIQWGNPVPCQKPGVYVVALHNDPMRKDGLPDISISSEALKSWLRRAPAMTIYNECATPDSLEKRLSDFWLKDETILYIGQTSQPLNRRIRQFYGTILGNRGPHRGGIWIKSLEIYNQLSFYWATTNVPKRKEIEMLRKFSETTGHLPFANLTGPNGREKHGIHSAFV